MSSFKSISTLLLLATYATAAPPQHEGPILSAMFGTPPPPDDVISVGKPKLSKRAEHLIERDALGVDTSRGLERRAPQDSSVASDLEDASGPYTEYAPPQLWAYTHHVGGWGDTHMVNINLHDCNNSIIRAYRDANTGELAPGPDSAIQWGPLQDNLQTEYDRATAAGEEPRYRASLYKALLDLGDNNINTTGIFDAKLLTPPVELTNANSKPPNYNIFTGYTIPNMALNLFGHGVNQTFSYAMRSRAPQTAPDTSPSPTALATAAMIFIGALLTDTITLVADKTDAGHYPHLSVRDAATIWASISVMRRFHDVSLNTLKNATPPVPVPITSLDQNDVNAAIAEMASGSFYSRIGPFEMWEDLDSFMKDASFDPFASGQCSPAPPPAGP